MPRIVQSTIRAEDVEVLTRSAQYNPPLDYTELDVFSEADKEKQQGDPKSPLAKRGFVHVPAVKTHGGIIARGPIRRDVTVNLIALRRLEGEGGQELRRYILGLALVAVTAPLDGFLRAGCLLTLDPEEPGMWHSVERTGQRKQISMDEETALAYARRAAESIRCGRKPPGVLRQEARRSGHEGKNQGAMMSRSLLIAVQFHEGRYHGQEDRFNGADGWPPSPGRLFQALVAGVAQGARLAAEDEQALKWLERLAPPKIAAPSARRGRVVKLFVPNNDLDSVGGNPARVGEIRVGKPWRPCFFDPDETVLYVWDFDSGSPEAVRICAIAARLYQLGRGIDMAWAIGQVLGQDEAAALLQSHPGPLRTPRGAGETVTPHSGTLDSLVDRYRHKRRRLSPVDPGLKFSQLFTQPPKASFRHAGYDTSPRCLHFELRGPENDFAPRPLASTAPLITGFRDAAARRLQDAQPQSLRCSRG